MKVTEKTRNLLIHALPATARAEVLSRADAVELAPDQILHDAGQPIELAYFPHTAIVALLGVLDGAHTVEMATLGNDGMVGLPPYLGVETATFRAVCQIGGWAHRIPAAALRELAAADPHLDTTLRRYAQTIVNQVAQTAACNCAHPVPQRLARWILLMNDRTDGEPFALGHGTIARFLGLRRASVTVAAGRLRREGLILYTRGRVTVADRGRLEAASCGCYHVLRRELDRLRSWPPATTADRGRTRAG